MSICLFCGYIYIIWEMLSLSFLRLFGRGNKYNFPIHICYFVVCCIKCRHHWHLLASQTAQTYPGNTLTDIPHSSCLTYVKLCHVMDHVKFVFLLVIFWLERAVVPHNLKHKHNEKVSWRVIVACKNKAVQKPYMRIGGN